MASGNFYRLLDFQSNNTIAFGKVFINSYFYEQTAGAGGAIQLASIFDTNVINAQIRLLQINQLVHYRIEVLNLTNPLEFTTLAINRVGSIAGEPCPSFVAYQFRLYRGSTAVRNGWKRIPGVPEGYANGNSISGAGVAQAASVASILAGNLTDGGGNTWVPKIARRPVGAGSWSFFPVASVGVGPLTTQNSRK